MRNARKTELPSALAGRVFLSKLAARTAPFALIGAARLARLPFLLSVELFVEHFLVLGDVSF
jgi:hypothetical protein